MHCSVRLLLPPPSPKWGLFVARQVLWCTLSCFSVLMSILVSRYSAQNLIILIILNTWCFLKQIWPFLMKLLHSCTNCSIYFNSISHRHKTDEGGCKLKCYITCCQIESCLQMTHLHIGNSVFVFVHWQVGFCHCDVERDKQEERSLFYPKHTVYVCVCIIRPD